VSTQSRGEPDPPAIVEPEVSDEPAAAELPAAAGPASSPRPSGGTAVPEQSREDTDAGWGEYPVTGDERLYQDRPPHWDDF
jgi:hypothetical protein